MTNRAIARSIAAGLVALVTLNQALAANWATFEDLDSRLSSEQKSQLPDLAIELELVQEGDAEFQYVFIIRHEDVLGTELATGLKLQFFDQHGFSSPDQAARDAYSWMYADLAEALLKPDTPIFAPEAGLRVLLATAQYGSTYAKTAVWLQLADSAYLPDSPELANAWESYLESGTPFEISDLDQYSGFSEDALPDPDLDKFTSCDDGLSEHQAIVTEFRTTQDAILATPNNAQQLAEAFHQKVLSMDRSQDDSRISFDFFEINFNAAIHLLASTYSDGISVYFEPDLDNGPMLVIGKNVPRMLLISLLVEAWGAQVDCQPGWIRIAADADKTSAPGKPFVIANFIQQLSVQEDGKTKLQWYDGTQYVGEVLNLQAHGQGRYDFANGGVLQGEFKLGVPDGRAKFSSADGTLTYDGEYLRGMRHGKGSLREDYSGVRFEGEFQHHQFEGSSDVVLETGNGEGWVRYSGPITDSVPNGTGHCRTSVIEYSCTFSDGYFVGIGELSLLPGNQ